MALREHGKTIAGATTGIAAVNIDGETVSRLCLLYKPELVESDVAALKKLFTGVHGLFIDEMSMLRASELSLVERRLRLATGLPLPFGGIAVILVGDFFQLPPVKGVRLFARAAGGKPHEDRKYVKRGACEDRPLTGEDLSATLKKMKARKAGGMDGWRVCELKTLPVPLLDAVSGRREGRRRCTGSWRRRWKRLC
ncbi:ATP-dependent DNA helicase pif1 [Diplonema papillatum]|nr:ATP-dependent DNA helicase pif1 [Diplonema papillatum]